MRSAVVERTDVEEQPNVEDRVMVVSFDVCGEDMRLVGGRRIDDDVLGDGNLGDGDLVWSHRANVIARGRPRAPRLLCRGVPPISDATDCYC